MTTLLLDILVWKSQQSNCSSRVTASDPVPSTKF